MLVRILVGIGESISVPASYRWIRLNFAENQRGLAIGFYYTGTKNRPAVGTPLAHSPSLRPHVVNTFRLVLLYSFAQVNLPTCFTTLTHDPSLPRRWHP